MRILQGLASLGLAAVAGWMLFLVGDPVVIASSGGGFGLLCVAWVVRPKQSRADGVDADVDGRSR